jgi:large subunit ribosomal protein L18
MIISKTPRLIIRGSLKHMTAQVAEALPIGDKIPISANSKNLTSFGWRAPSGNVPAAYLTGYLLGKKTVGAGVKKAILDIGLVNTTIGARVFATLKGVTDAGLSISHSEGILPPDQRIRGEHIVEYAKKLQEADPALYERRFSQYVSKDLRPEELPKHFAQVKEKIDEAFKEGK